MVKLVIIIQVAKGHGNAFAFKRAGNSLRAVHEHVRLARGVNHQVERLRNGFGVLFKHGGERGGIGAYLKVKAAVQLLFFAEIAAALRFFPFYEAVSALCGGIDAQVSAFLVISVPACSFGRYGHGTVGGVVGLRGDLAVAYAADVYNYGNVAFGHYIRRPHAVFIALVFIPAILLIYQPLSDAYLFGSWLNGDAVVDILHSAVDNISPKPEVFIEPEYHAVSGCSIVNAVAVSGNFGVIVYRVIYGRILAYIVTLASL